MGLKIRNGVLKKYAEDSGVKEVIIPDGVTNIANGAFKFCKTLERVVIPETVTCISDFAFVSCKNLTDVTIPASVVSIGKNAFSGCDKLIPQTGKKITPEASAQKPPVPPAEPETKPSAVPSEPVRETYSNTELLASFRQNPGDETISRLVRGRCPELMNFMLKDFEPGSTIEEETTQKMLDSGDIITKHNIDGLIRCAIAHQAYGVQTLLSRYKSRL